MTNVGIVTVWRSLLLTNYGSFFQHCALRYVLKSFGCTCFRCETESICGELFLYCLPLRFLRIQVLHWLGLRNAPKWQMLQLLFWRLRFYRSYRRLIGKLFEPQTNSDVVVYLAGGDTVWGTAERTFFLADRVQTNRCVSYAASAIWDEVMDNPDWQKIVHETLPRFSSLSVREKVGADMLRTILGRDVNVVVDPVLLLEKSELLQFAKQGKIFNKDTILYYSVNAATEDELNMVAVGDCAKLMGCCISVVGIQGAQFLIPKHLCARPAPEDFLAMVRDSAFVITQSFHGIVFSILLNRPFVFVRQSGPSKGDENKRQVELLTRLGLLDRMLDARPTSTDLKKILGRMIDWKLVNMQLSEERERCRAWLLNAVI